MYRSAKVHRLSMAGPDDVSLIRQAIDAGDIQPQGISAILGKTEGNGCVNDFTRGYAVQCLDRLLSDYLSTAQINSIPMIMSGGTEGGLSPHWVVFEQCTHTDKPNSQADTHSPALAFASTTTRKLQPSEVGRVAQCELIREAVHKAMREADITSPDDVHFVQIKCPLMTAERAEIVDRDVATTDTLRSMGLSRGACALGVAIALGEIAANQINDQTIGCDMTIWSGRASCSAGIELMHCEVVVMGQSTQWTGPLRICHGVMQDAIDASCIRDMLEDVFKNTQAVDVSSHIYAVLAKAEASKNGKIRGMRHTMLDDSDISSTRHARGFVGGLLAGLIGHTELFVSGGAEHQGPDGGGPVALIYSQA